MKKIIIYLLNKIGIPATDHNLTYKNMYSYIQSILRRMKMSFNLDKVFTKGALSEYLGFPQYKQEQVIYRLYIGSTNEFKCFENKECPCKCVFEDVVLSDNTCDKACYPTMMNELDWMCFKKDMGIYIDLINKKVVKYVKK